MQLAIRFSIPVRPCLRQALRATPRTLLVPLLCVIVSAAAQAKEARTTVAILMFDGVHIDFAAPYEVFGQARFDVYTVLPDGRPVTTVMDLSVNVDHDFTSAPPADVLLVPGGNVYAAIADKAVLSWLTHRANHADQVLSVCTGAYTVAATGLLDNASATTFHRSLEDFAAKFPRIDTVDDQR